MGKNSCLLASISTAHETLDLNALKTNNLVTNFTSWIKTQLENSCLLASISTAHETLKNFGPKPWIGLPRSSFLGNANFILQIPPLREHSRVLSSNFPISIPLNTSRKTHNNLLIPKLCVRLMHW